MTHITRGTCVADHAHMRFVGVMAAIASASCTGQLLASAPMQEDAGAPQNDPKASRIEFDDEVAPLLEERCRLCHGDPAMAPAFLASDDEYTTVMSWPVALVDLVVPENSLLLTKGDHDGPPWTEGEAAIVLSWIELEASDAASDPSTPPPDAGTGPCARLDSFTTLAAGPLSTECGNCHAGEDDDARAALDLVGIEDPSPSAQTAACGAVRRALDLDAPMNSVLFTEVDPLVEPDHPFQFNGDYAAFREFRTAILEWVLDQDEQP